MAIEMSTDKLGWLDTNEADEKAHQLRITVQMLVSNGILRFVSQILAISGQVRIAAGRFQALLLNRHHPMVERIQLAFEVLLQPYHIQVALTGT